MSLEASITELAQAIRALAEALPKGVATAPVVAPARRARAEKEQAVDKAAEPENPATVAGINLRATPVTDADIDKAAEETERRRVEKEAAAEAAAATAKAAAKAPAAEKPAQVEAGLRDAVRALIYKINAEQGRGPAVALLKKFDVATLTAASDDLLPAIKAAAEKALEPQTEDIG